MQPNELAVRGVSAGGLNGRFRHAAYKLAILTALSLAMGLAQGWVAARTYKPQYLAGFHTGLLHGMLMPAALPGLLLGQKLPIYAPSNTGNPYEIGFILGINTCGFFFFGTMFLPRQIPLRPSAATRAQ